MQLDKTSVTISQRNGVELVDLSLLVFQRYWYSIILISIVGILPFALIDCILLWPLTQYDQLVMSSRDIGDASFFQFRYLVIVTAVILIQSPFALSGLTFFIGQAVFGEKPSLRAVFAAIWNQIGAVVLIQGCLRMSILVFIPMAFLFDSARFRPEIELPLYLFCLCGYVYLLRGLRPFALEILLLERCPVYRSKKDKDKLAYSGRSHWLHSRMYFELLGMHIGVTIVEMLTALSLCLSSLFLIGVLSGIWVWGIWMDVIVYPMIIWSLAIWGTIIRFLNYMNSRIHTEGWEIELRLKAESLRLTETLPS